MVHHTADLAYHAFGILCAKGDEEMRCENIKTILIFTIVVLLCSMADIFAADSVEWTIQRTLQLEESAVDVAIAPDGRRIFVLTDQGKIMIYSSNLRVEAEMDVGKDVSQIKIGPQWDTLILNNRKNKTVQIISLDFIRNIDVSGSPYKGPEDAPVVVAVFSDFE